MVFSYEINIMTIQYRIYIFRNFNQYNLQNQSNYNDGEERRSGTIGTGVNQKDLKINEKTEKEKDAITKKLVQKRTRALQACSGGSDKLENSNIRLL